MEERNTFANTKLDSLTNSLNASLPRTETESRFLFTKGNLHWAAMAALLNIVSVGLMAAFTAPAVEDMRRDGSRFTNITSSQVAWIASLPGISAVLGNCLSGYFSSRCGRKTVLIFVSVPFVAGWLIIAYAPTIPWMYGGRLLCGFCYGVCAVSVPAYIIEISPVNIRGFLGSCFQLSYTVGVLIAMSFGIIGFRWSWLAIIGAFFATSAAVLMSFMPESPPWLISEGKLSETFAALDFLKGKDTDTSKAYSSAMDHFARQPLRTFAFHEFKEPHLYKPMALAIGLVFFQQFSGIGALLAYTVEIFRRAESALEPEVAAAVIAGVQVIATMIGCTLVDKAGRRKLFLVSGVFVTLGLVILGIYGIVLEKKLFESPVLGWVPLIGFITFVASFSLGYGPIPYLMAPEIVPQHSRSSVLAITGAFSSCFLFIVTKTFDDIRFHVSDYGTYWIYGLFSLLGCLFGWFCLPETKKKSITDIQYAFSSSFIPTPYDEI